MAAAAGIWNQAPGQALTGPAPMDTASGGSGGTDGTTSSATISANDFLTLLVTEMQNQDPTADTDPNEYINQLVQVNSLEQLIDINQNLTTALGGSGSGSGSGRGREALRRFPAVPLPQRRDPQRSRPGEQRNGRRPFLPHRRRSPRWLGRKERLRRARRAVDHRETWVFRWPIRRRSAWRSR